MAAIFMGVAWLLACLPALAELIPADRVIDWANTTIGVPGGIPARPTVYTSLSPGATVQAINAALADCPDNQVVLLQAGTYSLGSNLSVSRDDVTLRGAGMGKTILRFTGGGQGCISVGSSEWPRPTASITITGGATKGNTTVSVSSAASVVVGRMVRIEQTNLSYVHTLNGQNNNMSFMFLVTGTTADTVTFTPAIPFTLTQSPELAVYGGFLTQGVGIEDLTIEMQNSDAANAVFIQQAWGCWLKNVESAHSNARQFTFVWSSANTVRGCYTHDIRSSGPNHEGIDFYEDGCWNLIEDNLCVNGGFPMIVLGDSRGGCAGNVIAYNYCRDLDTGSDIANADISVNHGPHNMFNLFEGNVAMGFTSDGYFGSASHKTLFRNWFSASHPTLVQNVNAIYLNRWSYYFNIVGNVLGDSTFPLAPDGLYTSEANSLSYLVRLIYRLGYPNMGNNDFDDTYNPPSTSEEAFDLNVTNTLLRHGNYDYATDSVTWDPTITETALPESLYLHGKPDWWGALPWPAIGPDRSPMTGQIPAQARYSRSPRPTIFIIR